MAVWALIGFMGCGKSSIGRTAAKMLGVGGMPPQEFASLTPPSLRDGPPASVPRVARPSEAHHHASAAFIDLDEEIVRRCGKSIPEIFSAIGEAGFRAIERETLAELLYRSGVLPLREFASLTPPSADADGPPASVPRVARPSGAIATSSGNPSTKLLISLGGGTLTDPGSRELVKKNCKCIYLRATVETLAANLRWEGEAASRPMLAGADPKAPAESPDSLESRIASMMAARGPVYEKAADIILDIDGLDYSDVARQILNCFSGK